MKMKWAVVILTLTPIGLMLKAQEPIEVRVGIIGPQSSGTVGAAEQQESGIRAAIEEARTRWGIRVRVVACDDQSDPQRTLACARELEKQGVAVIIGSVNSLCTLELPKVAAELHIPIVSAISTATRLTRTAPVSDSRPTWFFRAALSDRYQMHWLAQWLADFRSLKPDEVAFVFEDSNAFVKNSSDEETRKSNHDIYGWGLRQDFLNAESWEAFAQKPIDVGISRGLVSTDQEKLHAILAAIAEGRKNRNNRPVRAFGLLTLWDEAREIVSFIRKDENRELVRTTFGLKRDEEPILFAGSGATSVDFYKSGGQSVVGTYLLSPFFVGESSATWQEFRKILSSHNVDAAHPDPYLALGYDSMSLIASCLNTIGAKKNGNSQSLTELRNALRACLAAGIEDSAALSLVTGLKGFDKTGEAIRDLAQTTYILRVGSQNTLVPVLSEDAGAALVHPVWWHPDGARLIWLMIGAALSLAGISAALKFRPAKLAAVEGTGIQPPISVAVSPFAPKEARPARNVVGEPSWFASEFFFGSDAASQQALQVVRKACVDSGDRKPVIIMGPPGVGKTQLAHLIHKASPRGNAGKPFYVVDCATITESLFDSELAGSTRGAFTGAVADRKGLLESADGGTVLFDEIGEISLELQARILRFLQNNEIRPVGSAASRKLNVRIIAATNKDLASLRPDLWGRLSQGNLVIGIPSLDSHWWDVPDYIDGLLRHFRTGVCISDQSLEILTACSWRSNFRALGCMNEAGVALGLIGEVAGSLPGGIITPSALRASVGSDPDVQQQLTRAIEGLGIALPPAERPDALFPDGMDKWFSQTDPRRAWTFVLDIIFNRLRGPHNESFLLAPRDSKRLAVSFAELSAGLGLADERAAVKSLQTSGVLMLPAPLRDRELSDAIARQHRRELILFAKRTNFIRFSHEELAEVCGVNRTKYYNFYHYAHSLAEEFYGPDVVPPVSRYVIDHRGEAVRSDRRSAFSNPDFENRVGQMTESFSVLRKLDLLSGRARL